MSRYTLHLVAHRDTDLSLCPGYMAAHGDNAHRPTNKPPIRCLLRLLFFRNEKILFITCCVLKICYYLCIGPLLVRGLDPTFRLS